MKTIFAKYNRERLPKYQIVTKIVVDEDGTKYALKEALCDEAKEHIENIYTNHELLKSSYDINLVKPTKLEKGLLFEMAEGKSLENILLVALDENDDQKFKKYIDKFLSFVDQMVSKRNVEFIPSKEFETIFGKWELDGNQDIIKVANVDLIFGNIFVNEKDEFSLIDYEWVFDFEIPKSYVVWRTINLFNLNRFDQQKNNLLDSYINNFFNINQFLKAEEFFYNYVLGNKKKYFLPQKVLKQTYSNETKISQRIEEKQAELIKISDWATELKEQVDILEKQLFDKNMSIEEKQAELIKISDWATELKEQVDILEKQLFDKNMSIEEKQAELIKISDWATELKEQVDILEKQLFDKNMSIEEKQAELIKISDWATELKEQVDILEKQLFNKNMSIEEKQAELIKISDWATELKEQVDILEKQLFDKNMSIEEKQAELIKISDWAMQLNTRLNKIENNFILRNIEKILNKERSVKNMLYKISKKTAKKVLPNFILNKIKQKINNKKTMLLLTENEKELSINKNSLNFSEKNVLYVFPVIDWLFRIQRPQQIAKGFFNSGYKVVYFKTVFAVSELPGYAYEIIDDKIVNVTLFLNEEKNIYKDNLNESNIQFLLKSISKLEKDFLINRRISIVDHPFWIHLSKKLSGNFTIYDCMDYHPGFGDDSAYLVELEEIAMTQSDLLVLTSSDLFERFSSKNKNSILVRNGCEFDFFNKKPENIYKSKYEKVIGYYGAISSWFDTEILISLAKYFSNYEFLLVGSTYGCEKLEELEKLKNVTLIGEVEYTKLTEYLYSFDVAIMPFKINELTIATNPVKVYEYLSSAVSVVATKLPEIDFMGDVVYSAITVDDFIHQINSALVEPSKELLNERLDFAKSNDWQSRYEQIESKISEIKSNQVKVSIILVTYNNLDFTKACLYSMEKFNNYENCEIIVVDNLSQDGTREYLTEYEENHNNFKAILHDCNSGFAAGNNIGIKEAKGEYVILLNNDTFVTPNWIQNLIKHFTTDYTIGMIGPRTNNIGNESRLEIHYSDMNQMTDNSYDIYYNNVLGQYHIPILAFFCVAIKRDIIEKIGLLDEIFGIGMFEDDDYCLRVKKEGYKLICADDVFIHHHLGASFNKDPEWKEQLFQKNKAIYESRWGKWEGHSYRKISK